VNCRLQLRLTFFCYKFQAEYFCSHILLIWRSYSETKRSAFPNRRSSAIQHADDIQTIGPLLHLPDVLEPFVICRTEPTRQPVSGWPAGPAREPWPGASAAGTWAAQRSVDGASRRRSKQVIESFCRASERSIMHSEKTGTRWASPTMH